MVRITPWAKGYCRKVLRWQSSERIAKGHHGPVSQKSGDVVYDHGRPLVDQNAKLYMSRECGGGQIFVISDKHLCFCERGTVHGHGRSFQIHRDLIKVELLVIEDSIVHVVTGNNFASFWTTGRKLQGHNPW